jgi:hypothetical protein
MKRTLLAIGIAVLVSMMIVPHGHHDNLYRDDLSMHAPFFIHRWPYYESESNRSLNIPAGWRTMWLAPIKGDELALQTIFLATLFAVAVNIRWKRPKK